MKILTNKKRLETIRIIATLGHKGQLDKVGEDYIGHLERVAYAGETISAKIVGLLHDLAEDGHLPVWELAKTGLLSEKECFALYRLDKHASKRRWEKYQTVENFNKFYLRRIKYCSLAREVKIADLRDNMDYGRFIRNNVTITEKDAARFKKYSESLAYLLGD
jgi:(p)ppGpp synthase/HD superfamily hydrolase